METAKAIVDVPAPYTGRVTKLYGQVGDTINTGEPLAAFEEAESDKPTDAGAVVGNIEVGDEVITESATGVTPQAATKTSIKVTPAVRALAKRLGVSLETIQGSGPNQNITAQDVQQAADSAPPATAPLSSTRRAMVAAMQRSHQEVVPAIVFDDADIHGWVKGTDFTLRMIQAVCYACQQEPNLNAHFNAEAQQLLPAPHVQLGIAVDTPHGLYVPVLRDADITDPKALRERINNFKKLAQSHEISKENLEGSTITLSNFGTMAGRYGTPIVIPPQVAIIAVGAARDGVVPVDGQPVVHRILPLSLAFDHRVITGGEASRFMGHLIQALQAP